MDNKCMYLLSVHLHRDSVCCTVYIYICIFNILYCNIFPINFFALLHRITITTPGKYAAIKAGVLPCLVNLLTDKSSDVRLNALEVILCENQTMYCILKQLFYSVSVSVS